jgi:hypothetical protein
MNITGFALAGLHPFSIREIFKQGLSWRDVSEDNAKRIIATIPALAEEVKLSYDGACLDAKITELLGDIVSTNMVNLDSKVLNQRRAVWLTPQKARNVFVKIQEKKLSDERLASEKRDIKAQAVLLKSNRASLVAQVANISIQGRQEATAIKVRCNNDCGALRKVTPLVTIVPYDKWLGCTV